MFVQSRCSKKLVALFLCFQLAFVRIDASPAVAIPVATQVVQSAAAVAIAGVVTRMYQQVQAMWNTRRSIEQHQTIAHSQTVVQKPAVHSMPNTGTTNPVVVPGQAMQPNELILPTQLVIPDDIKITENAERAGTSFMEHATKLYQDSSNCLQAEEIKQQRMLADHQRIMEIRADLAARPSPVLDEACRRYSSANMGEAIINNLAQKDPDFFEKYKEVVDDAWGTAFNANSINGSLAERAYARLLLAEKQISMGGLKGVKNEYFDQMKLDVLPYYFSPDGRLKTDLMTDKQATMLMAQYLKYSFSNYKEILRQSSLVGAQEVLNRNLIKRFCDGFVRTLQRIGGSYANEQFMQNIQRHPYNQQLLQVLSAAVQGNNLEALRLGWRTNDPIIKDVLSRHFDNQGILKAYAADPALLRLSQEQRKAIFSSVDKLVDFNRELIQRAECKVAIEKVLNIDNSLVLPLQALTYQLVDWQRTANVDSALGQLHAIHDFIIQHPIIDGHNLSTICFSEKGVCKLLGNDSVVSSLQWPEVMVPEQQLMLNELILAKRAFGAVYETGFNAAIADLNASLNSIQNTGAFAKALHHTVYHPECYSAAQTLLSCGNWSQELSTAEQGQCQQIINQCLMQGLTTFENISQNYNFQGPAQQSFENYLGALESARLLNSQNNTAQALQELSGIVRAFDGLATAESKALYDTFFHADGSCKLLTETPLFTDVVIPLSPERMEYSERLNRAIFFKQVDVSKAALADCYLNAMHAALTDVKLATSYKTIADFAYQGLIEQGNTAQYTSVAELINSSELIRQNVAPDKCLLQTDLVRLLAKGISHYGKIGQLPSLVSGINQSWASAQAGRIDDAVTQILPQLRAFNIKPISKVPFETRAREFIKGVPKSRLVAVGVGLPGAAVLGPRVLDQAHKVVSALGGPGDPEPPNGGNACAEDLNYQDSSDSDEDHQTLSDSSSDSDEDEKAGHHELARDDRQTRVRRRHHRKNCKKFMENLHFLDTLSKKLRR